MVPEGVMCLSFFGGAFRDALFVWWNRFFSFTDGRFTSCNVEISQSTCCEIIGLKQLASYCWAPFI